MDNYTDSADKFKLNLFEAARVNDEEFAQMLFILHVCYDISNAPKGTLGWVETLYLTREFSKNGPVKLYDRWIARRMAPSEDLIDTLIRSYQEQRQILFKWQQSDQGILIVDGKLIWDSQTLEWFYLYEFPFLRLVERVWSLCPIGLSTPRIKSIARREFDRMYPERGNQPKLRKRKQSPEEKLKRVASSLLSLLADYKTQHGEKVGPIFLESDLNELLEERGKPLIITVPNS